MKAAKNLFVWLWLWFAMAIAASFFDDFSMVWLVTGTVIAVMALIDGYFLCRMKAPYVQRQLRGSHPVNVWHTIKIRVVNAHEKPVVLSLHDHHPVQAESRHQPQEMVIAADAWGEISYQIRFMQRGNQTFGMIQVLV